jgi:hypothetical protein
MIQRIQTVYLLASLLLSVLMLQYPFYISGTIEIGASNIFLFLMTILLALLHMPAIFLFKKRQLQKVFCYMLIMDLVLYIFISLFITKAETELWFDISNFRIGAAFPIVSIVLSYLAIQGINKDEALIKSMDRLR